MREGNASDFATVRAFFRGYHPAGEIENAVLNQLRGMAVYGSKDMATTEDPLTRPFATNLPGPSSGGKSTRMAGKIHQKAMFLLVKLIVTGLKTKSSPSARGC